ncbi:MAG: maleylpyruvate isomerase N-terminal domain-containing protein [Mycobacteriales bacterium]
MLPLEDVQAVAASHARLKQTVARLTDVSAASALPDWSVGHVLAHLARNADSIVYRLEAMSRGQLVPQYEGGAAGRAADIARGAARPAAEIVDDLVAACDRLDAFFLELPEQVWGTEVLAGIGTKKVPATRLALARWREVEIHHVDLGLSYTPAQWPVALVERVLPDVLHDLPTRTDPARLLAWATGRGAAPALDSWS